MLVNEFSHLKEVTISATREGNITDVDKIFDVLSNTKLRREQQLEHRTLG